MKLRISSFISVSSVVIICSCFSKLFMSVLTGPNDYAPSRNFFLGNMNLSPEVLGLSKILILLESKLCCRIIYRPVRLHPLFIEGTIGGRMPLLEKFSLTFLLENWERGSLFLYVFRLLAYSKSECYRLADSSKISRSVSQFAIMKDFEVK